MNGLMLLFSAAAVAAPAPVMPPPPTILSAPVKHDVQCFMLYAVAVHSAENDDKVKQAAGLGVMYFFAKLKVEAPTIDLFETIRTQAAGMKAGPELKAVGESCDTEFQQRGAELRDLGGRLKQTAS